MRHAADKRKKRQSGLTMVETIVACVLLMMVITLFGSITVFTINLSFREKQQSQTEILTDTLITRIDETLRFADKVSVITDANGTGISFSSETFPAYGGESAKLYCTTDTKQLVVYYNGKPYQLLPNDSYENMEAELENIKLEGGVLTMTLKLSGKNYSTGYQQTFTVHLVNG